MSEVCLRSAPFFFFFFKPLIQELTTLTLVKRGLAWLKNVRVACLHFPKLVLGVGSGIIGCTHSL